MAFSARLNSVLFEGILEIRPSTSKLEESNCLQWIWWQKSSITFWKPEKKCPFFCQIWWADNTVLVITCEDWCLFGLVLFKTCFKSSNYVLFVSLVSDLNYLFTVVSAIVDDPSMCLGWQFFVSRCQVILSCHFGCFSVLCFSQLKLLFFIPKQPVLIHLDWFI